MMMVMMRRSKGWFGILTMDKEKYSMYQSTVYIMIVV